MPRENSPLIVGDYWLDKRRDGLSPEIWQVATYASKSRSVVYRSTKQRSVEAAGAFLRAYEAQRRSTARDQPASQAQILPHLFNYLREHGPDVERLDTVKSSFRAWIGFLMQDDLGTGATVADLTKTAVARFRRWRMGVHSWEIEWDGKTYHHSHNGVLGQTVQRNIEDLRSALHHAEGEHRIVAPKVASVDKKKRQKKKQRKPLTAEQLGALWGYARASDDDVGIAREIALMLGTSSRPGAAQAFDPETQWQDDVIDLQPAGKELTDKRNATVPTIDPLRPILADWAAEPHTRVKSRKQWWETARRALDMPGVEAYDIRHTIATMLDNSGVPGVQLGGVTGHIPATRNIARTTKAHYLHYDPHNAPQAKRALTKFFLAVQKAADLWLADHERTIPVRGQPIEVVKRLDNALENREKLVVGADGLEPPTLSV